MVDGTADTQELWPQLLQVVKERMRFAWILLSQNASVLFYDGTTLTLNMFSPGAYDTLISSDCRIVLDEVLAELVNPPPAVELLVQGKIPSPPGPEDSTHVHAPGAASATDTSPEPDEPLTSILHRILAQTAFLLYEDGNSQAAALLADVEDLEHFPGDRPEEGEDIALIVPLYLVGRFTPEVLAAIQPLFVHVAARHDLLVDNVSAIPALPETGDEWRQNLQEKLINKTPPQPRPRTLRQGDSRHSQRRRFRLSLPGATARLRGVEAGAGTAAAGFHHCRLPAAKGPARQRPRLGPGLYRHRLRPGGCHRGRRSPSPRTRRRGRCPRQVLAQQRNRSH